jgi:hypothetical protein
MDSVVGQPKALSTDLAPQGIQGPNHSSKSIGANAIPFFKLATDLSRIFRERAEIASGDTSTRG